MRQVPKYLVIGSGQMAQHMNHYFSLEKIPFLTWSRKSQKDLTSLAQQATHILLLVKDSAIQELSQHKALQGKQLIHFSGSQVIDEVIGCHPLMTFSKKLYGLDVYRKFPFVIESEGPSFKELFPALKNPNHEIKPELKPLYHALCVSSGNITNMIWSQVMREFETKLNIPYSALLPYLGQVTQNISENPFDSLTGPIARKDWKTVIKNLEALEDSPLREVYEGFVPREVLQ